MLLKNNTLLKSQADFGDVRLNHRLGRICNQISQNLGQSIPQASSNRSEMKATYRFFQNDKVSMDKIIAAHLSVHQRDRDKVHKQVLLVPQDTTGLIYTNKRSGKDFGPINFKNQRGAKLHNSLIISPTGVPVGLFKQSVIIRSDATFGKRNHPKREPIEDKESYRWIEHFNELQDYFEPYPNIEVFSICDREADIFELLSAKRLDHVHLIVRSKHNRIIDPESKARLHQQVASSPLRSTFKIKVTDRKTCKKRTAQVQLRFCPVNFSLSTPNKWQRDLPPISLWLLQIEEINPPKGKKGVKWILLSTKAIQSVAQAKTIVRYYELRWLIERFHFILKSGTQVTQLQLKTPKRILNAVSAYSISAVNLMRINYLAREYPQWSIYEIGITNSEYQALYQYAHVNMDKRLTFNPNAPPTLKEFVITIARLGGFTNFSNQDHPGLKTFWRGWNTYQTILKTFFTFMSKN